MAGIQFIFFRVAGTVLCFGFRMRITFMKHLMFLLLLSSAYPKSSIFQAVTSVEWLGEGTESWEEMHLGQLTQTVRRDIPYHRMSCWTVSVALSMGVKLSFPGVLSRYRAGVLVCVHPSLFVKCVLLVLVMCFSHPFPCYVTSLPSTFKQ